MSLMIAAKPSPIAYAKQKAHLNAIIRSLQADRRFWLSQEPSKMRNRKLAQLDASIWEAETNRDVM